MPAKNIVKHFKSNTFYHVYNRGVEKREIFLDDQDFRVLLYYFKIYLSDPKTIGQLIVEKTLQHNLPRVDALYRSLNNSFFNKIELHCYTLMPNHFHLLIKQTGQNDLSGFIKAIFTKYTMYFNKRYQRVGPLLQGAYKAVEINTNESFKEVSRYIHLNPQELHASEKSSYESWDDVYHYPYSSCRYYIDPHEVCPFWLTKNRLLEYFKTPDDYKAFLGQGLTLAG